MRVLFIGNSYTHCNDLPGIVGQLFWARQLVLEHESVTPGGCTLELHWQHGHARAAILRELWDFVVLQEHSMRPFCEREAMFRYARLLHGEVAQTGARTLLYETWAAKIAPDEQPKLTDAYATLAREFGATVVPVGTAWQRALAAGLELHDLDGRHPNRRGSYLGACLFARVLSGQSVVDVSPPIIENGQPWTWPDAAETAALRGIAEATWSATAA